MITGGFGEKRKNIPVPCGDATLEGYLAIPPNAPGLVLFSHGSGSSRHNRHNQFLAEAINQAGLGTLLFDLLTAEEEFEDIESYAFRFDIHLLARRLTKVTGWVAEYLPQYRIAYCGSGTGGGAALTAAADLGNEIGAIVLRDGRPDLAGRALSRVTAPTLLIVGEEDESLLTVNQTALTRLSCQKSLSIMARAMNLTEQSESRAEIGRLTSQWFRHYLYS